MWSSSIRTVARHWPNALSVSIAAGLGLGLNVAVCAVLTQLLLRPPPYPEPDRLVLSDGPISEGELQTWRDSTTTVQEVAGVSTGPATITSQGLATRSQVSRVSHSLFGLLAVEPVAGRVFTQADPPDDVAVVEEATARRLFGSSEAAAGKRVTIDGVPVEIVGVLPVSFGFPDATVEFWRPIGRQTLVRRNAAGRVSVSVTSFPIIARLAPDATLAQARAEFEAALIPRRASNRPALVDFHSARTRETRRPLVLLQCVVLLVLALGLCNATLLMFAHYRSRRTEFAIRAALGASVPRIVRTLMGESLLVGLLAALVATGTALLGLTFLRRAIGAEVSGVHLDSGMLAAGLVASCLLLMLASLVAASSCLRRVQASEMACRGPAARSRMRHALLTAQIAVSGVLVIASVSAISSLGAAAEALPRAVSRDVLTADVHLVGPAYAAIEARVAFAERLVERLAERHVPAAVTGALPFSEAEERGRLRPPGNPRTISAHEGDVTTHYLLASPGYFEAMGWPILRGRGLRWADSQTAAPVVVITRSLAVERLGHADVVGEYIRFSGRAWRVVGVVDDLPAAPGVPAIATAYVSIRQLSPWESLGLQTMTVVVGGRTATPELASHLTEVVRAVDPGVALSRLSTLEARATDSAAFLVFFRDLLSALSLVAVTLGAFGLYGVVTAIVCERRPEIAVRLSLGAGRRRVAASVLRLGLWPVALGLILAVPGALIIHGLFRTAVPGIVPLDLWSVSVVVAVVVSAAAGACLLPAIRAMRIDPSILLKS